MSANEHGSFSTYTNYGCRCEDCRAANTAKQHEWRTRNRAHRAAYMRRYRARKATGERSAVTG